MQAIISFLDGISVGLFTAFEWFADFLSEQMYFTGLLYSFLSNFAVFFSWLPPSVIAILFNGFVLVVIMRIFKY